MLLILSLIWNKLFNMSTNTDADSQSWEKGKEKLSGKVSNTVLHQICFAYITSRNIDSSFFNIPSIWWKSLWLFLRDVITDRNFISFIWFRESNKYGMNGMEDSFLSGGKELLLWGGDIWAKKLRIKKTKCENLEQRKWLVQSLESKSTRDIWVHWKRSFP